jgi:hypothetical protein
MESERPVALHVSTSHSWRTDLASDSTAWQARRAISSGSHGVCPSGVWRRPRWRCAGERRAPAAAAGSAARPAGGRRQTPEGWVPSAAGARRQTPATRRTPTAAARRGRRVWGCTSHTRPHRVRRAAASWAPAAGRPAGTGAGVDRGRRPCRRHAPAGFGSGNVRMRGMHVHRQIKTKRLGHPDHATKRLHVGRM